MRGGVHYPYSYQESPRARGRQPAALEILYHAANAHWAREHETLSGCVVERAFNFNPELDHRHQVKLSSELFNCRKLLLEPRDGSEVGRHPSVWWYRGVNIPQQLCCGPCKGRFQWWAG